MRPAKELVKQLTRRSDLYRIVVVHDENRWLWSVTTTSTVLRDQAHWGRLLGCGEAADERGAWQGARRLIGNAVGSPPQRGKRRVTGKRARGPALAAVAR